MWNTDHYDLKHLTIKTNILLLREENKSHESIDDLNTTFCRTVTGEILYVCLKIVHSTWQITSDQNKQRQNNSFNAPDGCYDTISICWLRSIDCSHYLIACQFINWNDSQTSRASDLKITTKTGLNLIDAETSGLFSAGLLRAKVKSC